MFEKDPSSNLLNFQIVRYEKCGGIYSKVTIWESILLIYNQNENILLRGTFLSTLLFEYKFLSVNRYRRQYHIFDQYILISFKTNTYTYLLLDTAINK